MTFDRALLHLRTHKKVARDGWNGTGMWVELQTPDTHSKMTLPYLFMKTAQDHLIPWVASHSDLLAGDWVVVE